jgi:ribosome-binding ATPase
MVAKLDRSKKTTYPEVVFVDPEGFPADTAKGLGGEMLGMVRDADLLALVIRAFSNPRVMHPSGTVNPERDLETCFADMIVGDLSVFEKVEHRVAKEFERGKKELKREYDLLHKSIAALNDGKLLIELDLAPEEKILLEQYEPLSLKQGIVVWNVDEDAEYGRGGVGVPDNIKQKCDDRKWGAGAASLAIESDIMDIAPEDRDAFLSDLGLTETIQDRFLGAIYKRLGLITFFTGGPVEAAARQIPAGSSAWDAAGKVHNDIQKGFIRAEVMGFEDLQKHGSVDAVRKAGKYRLEKREYVVQDGDIIFFRFNK